MSAKVTVIVYILICFEVGVLLAILPWTAYWDDNFFRYFLASRLHAPWLANFLQSGYVRGAVTGLGALNVFAGLRDIFKFRESVHALAALEAPLAEADKSVAVEPTVTPPITLSDHRPPSVPPGS
jgi:hypothetical protein